jgi:site-specific recombinase XerD
MSSIVNYVSCYRDYLILKNYSPRTVKSYLRFVREFLEYASQHKDESLSFEEYSRNFLLSLNARHLSWSTINSYYSAMKILCEKVLRIDWKVSYIPRPKTSKMLPRILSQEEVIRLIESPRSLKHRIIIALLYATGLRISEVIHLKLGDIDSDRMEIYVRQGKGKKDRMVVIPAKLLYLLRMYYKRYRPKEYLFEGQGENRIYSQTSVRKILRSAQIKAKIAKTVSPHMMRHCYATHHLECGTDLVFLKEQLGHTNLKSTSRYIHLCQTRQRNINHPIDQIMIDII